MNYENLIEGKVYRKVNTFEYFLFRYNILDSEIATNLKKYPLVVGTLKIRDSPFLILQKTKLKISEDIYFIKILIDQGIVVGRFC